ncbi:MAG TPA: CARDB domain-containing protein, partial [Protaetiibacter sp.]|nr:CARDB domain-containing protein [Protaetiibacter sp.]
MALLVPIGFAAVAPSAAAAPVRSLLSAGKTATASSHNQSYVAGHVTDGDLNSYWESTSTFPQWVQVDLGAVATVTDLTLALPTGWEARDETLSVRGSTDGSSFTTLTSSASYTILGGTALGIDVTDTSARYVRVAVTANTGWPAAQLSEVQVYGESSTPPVDPPAGSNLAQGRPVSATSVQQNYVAANAVDGSTSSYWEGAPGAYPSALTVSLAQVSTVTGVVVRLNPDTAWGERSQTFAIQGRSGTGAFTDLVASASYTFTPSTGNAVTIPVLGSATDVRLVFSANTGSTNAQVAEFEVIGTADQVPTSPDLQVAFVAPTGPVSPDDAIELQATARNSGTATSAATTVAFSFDGQSVGTANVGELAPGAQTTVSINAGQHAAGTHPVTVTVDPAHSVAESNESNNTATGSVTVTDVVTPPTGDDLALGRPTIASSTQFTFVAANAVDTDPNSYWEGGGGQYPSTLAVSLASVSTLQQVVVSVPPQSAWGPRTQTFSIEAKSGAGSWQTVVPSAAYSFSNASGNKVTVPVSGTASDVRLVFTGNTGAGNGQVAGFTITGVPAPNPDLTVTDITASPVDPIEGTALTLAATVTNVGNLASPATTLDLTVDGAIAATVAVPAIPAGGTTTVSTSIGTLAAGSYGVGAVVDPSGTVVEQSEANNAYTRSTELTVAEAPGPDLQVLGITSTPANPGVGTPVSFTVSVNNRGSEAAGASVTELAVGGTTLTGSTPAIASGDTATVALSGTWTATSGGASLTARADAAGAVTETNENNNTLSKSIVVG